MTDYELAQIALSISEQIDFLWNFYVAACGILLGWLFSSKIEWNHDKQRAVTILFLMFAVVNLSAIYNAYSLLEAAMDSIQSNLEHNGDSFIKKFSDFRGIGSIGAAVVHLAADFFIYSLIRKSFIR
ncbi:hypothetical protein [Colwellia piezophila]|uniref:hypothetical protein n=1 Tax=Colwellia piezophila TaxID=211668 RepID=UPI00035D973D|nr:hypothetical protein [Colwellia piezophila]